MAKRKDEFGHEEEHKESAWGKWVVMSTCCPSDPLCRTMYDVIFCSRCGVIHEKRGITDYIRTTHNMFRYSDEAWIEFQALVSSGHAGYTPDLLYLHCKGILDVTIKRTSTAYVREGKPVEQTVADVEQLKHKALSRVEKEDFPMLGTHRVEPAVEVEVKDEPKNPDYQIKEEDFEKEVPF